MHPDKRRAGRAIRKQRRLEREAVQAVLTMDMRPIIAAIEGMHDAIATAVAEFASFAESLVVAAWEGWRAITRRWEWEYQQKLRREFEWRLSHRALTTGRE
jgi:hypothetical protein